MALNLRDAESHVTAEVEEGQRSLVCHRLHVHSCTSIGEVHEQAARCCLLLSKGLQQRQLTALLLRCSAPETYAQSLAHVAHEGCSNCFRCLFVRSYCSAAARVSIRCHTNTDIFMLGVCSERSSAFLRRIFFVCRASAS